MIHRPKTHMLVPLLALGMTLAMAALVQAQDRQYQGSSRTSGSFQVNFGTRPDWADVRGTRVQEIRQGDRPGYDMFRYGRNYYVYDNNRWYMSRRWRGRFIRIDDRSVPWELRRIPRDHWRNYPAAWQGRGYEGSGGTSATLQVNFGSTPHWVGIGGTRVEEVALAERPNYDVFRYGGTYYVYNDARWYTSPRESGEFTMIDDRSLPGELSQVPRDHWRNYPSAWQNQNGNDQRDSRGRNDQGRGHN